MLPKTLLAMAGFVPQPVHPGRASLILIDFQYEYLEGPLALPGAGAAIRRARRLLDAARKINGRIIHVAHKGAPGGMFDRSQHRGQIIAELAPLPGETIVEKPRPNAFSGTDLVEFTGNPKSELILMGFMTHMCVSSTARAALDLGYVTTIAADACATRDLPDRKGGIVAADDLHEAELAALSDRFATISSVDEILRAGSSA